MLGTRRIVLFLLIAVLLGVTGIVAVSRYTFAAGQQGRTMSIDGTSWNLTAIDGKPVVDGSAPTLSFEDGQVAGAASVNHFFGSYTVAGGNLSIGQLGSTKMAGPPELMQQEDAYLAALGAATGFSIDGLTLTITHGSGTLSFAKA